MPFEIAAVKVRSLCWTARPTCKGQASIQVPDCHLRRVDTVHPPAAAEACADLLRTEALRFPAAPTKPGNAFDFMSCGCFLRHHGANEKVL